MNRYADIRQWAEDRNLIEGSNPSNQFLKTLSEFGELADGVNKNRIAEIKDGIGDVKVTIVIIAKQLGFDLEKQPLYPLTMPDVVTKHTLMLLAASALGSFAESLVIGDPDIYKLTDIDRNLLDVIAVECGLTPEECIDHAWDEIKDRKGRMVDGVFIKEGDVEV
jgi:NTP pyrophosphatase (non-canonical NTP hydrolase)